MSNPTPFRRLSTLPVLLLLLHCGSPNESEPLPGGTGSAGTGNGSAGSSVMTGGGSGTGASATAGAPAGGSGTGGSSTTPGAGQSSSGGGNNVVGGGGSGAIAGSSGAAQGGATQGGAAQGGATGGGGSVSGGAGGGGTRPDDTTISTTIPTPSNGQGEIRNGTTVLKNAANGGKDVWDFGNQKIGVNNTAECEGSEGQTTVFELEDGVTVRNLIVAGGIAGGNGIVCKGNCTLEYVYWEDVCEDAATNSKDGATMTLNHVIALKATDKVFQHNAKGGSKTVIKNSYISDFGKLWRSCGDCTANGGPRHLSIDNVKVDGIKTAVAGANQNYGDTVTIKNLYVKGGYDASKDKPKICTEYIGVTDHDGESTKVDDGKSRWSTTACKVTQADVKSY
jgi:pectate lyase